MWKGGVRGESCVTFPGVVERAAPKGSPLGMISKSNFLPRVTQKVRLGFLLLAVSCSRGRSAVPLLLRSGMLYTYTTSQPTSTSTRILQDISRSTGPVWFHDGFYDSPRSCQHTPIRASPLPVRGTCSQRAAAMHRSIPECMGVQYGVLVQVRAWYDIYVHSLYYTW